MDALNLVISALQEMKTIYDDISTSNESCRDLAQHCEDLANPVKQIQDNSDLIDTNSAALSSLLALLNDCKSFCKVFNTRSVFDAVTHHNRDKDAFISLHRRLDSAAASFNLQLAAAMRVNMAEIERKAREDRDLTNRMLMQLLEAQGKQQEFMALPQGARKEFLQRARAVSANIIDLANLDAPDSETAQDTAKAALTLPGDTTAQALGQSASMGTKLSVLSSLVEDLDFGALRYWNAQAPDISRKLGSGSFGAVYRCEYQGKEIALKHFSCLADSHVKPTARELRSIRKEACILQYCSTHKNVIGFVGVSVESGILLMELATCSLNAVIYGRPSLFPTLPSDIDTAYLTSFAYKSSVVRDVASALHFLHFHKILHRDIKSCNVIMVLTPATATAPSTLVPKLSDFGLAAAAGAASKTIRTKEGVVGSTPYMSPEILIFDTPEPVYSAAVDIYALGILANEIFSERMPWSGLQDGQILGKVCYQKMRPPAYVPPPEEALQLRVMQEVVGDATHGCLHQDPASRPSAKYLGLKCEVLRLAAIWAPPTSNVEVIGAPPAGAGEPVNSEDSSLDPVYVSPSTAELLLQEALDAALAQEITTEEVQAGARRCYEDDLRAELGGLAERFEEFALRAVAGLQALQFPEAADMFVAMVMTTVHQTSARWVVERTVMLVHKDSVLDTIQALTEGEIRSMMEDLGPNIVALHEVMSKPSSVSSESLQLSIPTLIRAYLRLSALALLSSGTLQALGPVPGHQQAFTAASCREILRPARFTGDVTGEVEVVMCGFQSGDAVKSVPCLVRRLPPSPVDSATEAVAAASLTPASQQAAPALPLRAPAPPPRPQRLTLPTKPAAAPGTVPRPNSNTDLVTLDTPTSPPPATPAESATPGSNTAKRRQSADTNPFNEQAQQQRHFSVSSANPFDESPSTPGSGTSAASTPAGSSHTLKSVVKPFKYLSGKPESDKAGSILVKKLMRVGVRQQIASEALELCHRDYQTALRLVHNNIKANIEFDPAGNSAWGPRIDVRIKSWLPNVTCKTTKAVHTGYVMQVSYLRISDGLQQAWELTYHYHVFRDLHHKLSRYLPASSFDADSQFPSMVSTFLTGFSDKVKFDRLAQLDRWMVKICTSALIMTVPEVAQALLDFLEVEARVSE